VENFSARGHCDLNLFGSSAQASRRRRSSVPAIAATSSSNACRLTCEPPDANWMRAVNGISTLS
jgi:hypothetical protein